MHVAEVREEESSVSTPSRTGSAPRRPMLAGLAVVLIVVVVAAAFTALRLRSTSGSAGPTAVTPTLSVPPAQRLSWAPPTLTDPITITVSADNRDLRLQPDRDYRIVLPTSPLTLTGGLTIAGGHNVVLIGGEIVVPSASDAPEPRQRRGLLLHGQYGTVHVEGLRISGDDLSEGIDLDELDSTTVQLENIAVGTVHGTRSGNHADVVQSWAGPSRLRIDGLTGSTTYQGLFLLPNQFLDVAPTSFDLRRIVLTSDTNNPEGKAGYLLWTADSAPWMHASDITLVDPRHDLASFLRPVDVWAPSVTVQASAKGAPLPQGTPGAGYATPGYAETTGSP